MLTFSISFVKPSSNHYLYASNKRSSVFGWKKFALLRTGILPVIAQKRNNIKMLCLLRTWQRMRFIFFISISIHAFPSFSLCDSAARLLVTMSTALSVFYSMCTAHSVQILIYYCIERIQKIYSLVSMKR